MKECEIRISIWAVNGCQSEVWFVRKFEINCQGFVIGYEIIIPIFFIYNLNETFLSKKHNFKIPGYDTIRNGGSTGQGGDVAFVIKHGLAVNEEYRNNDFNIITDEEALETTGLLSAI